MNVQCYLNFNGRCEEALNFYSKAVGAKVGMMMRFKPALVGGRPVKQLVQQPFTYSISR